MGLTTALVLLFKGYNVHMISSLFPEKSILFNGRKEHMASQIAGGLILPIFYDSGGGTDNRRMIKETWDLIRRLHAESEYTECFDNSSDLKESATVNFSKSTATEKNSKEAFLRGSYPSQKQSGSLLTINSTFRHTWTRRIMSTEINF